MNRFLRSASIWLAALLLTACTHAPAVTTGTSTGTGTSAPLTSQTATSAVTTTTAPLPPATEPPLTLPETAPPTTEAPPETLPTPPQQVVYPSWKEHGDIELLAAIEGDGGDLLHMSQYENEVLLSFAVLGAESSGFLSAYVQMLDLTTGVLSQPAPLPAPEYVASFLENGRICLYDSMGGIAAVYDRKGNQLFSFVSGDIEGTLYLDPTGDGTLWSYTWESSILTRVPLGGGAAQRIALPASEYGYITCHRKGVLYYTAWNGEQNAHYAITADGEVTLLEIPERYYWSEGCLYTDTRPNRIIDPADPHTVYQIGGDRTFFWAAAAVGDSILVERYAPEEDREEIFSYYEVLDYRNGVYYPAISTDPTRFYGNFYSPEEGVLCFATGRSDDYGITTDLQICRWNYLHDGESVEVEILKTDSLANENDAIAARIGEKWGVKVYYQPHLLHLVASDYSAAAITDPDLLRTHLLQLESALSAYPEGFFNDLCYGDYTHLEIYLCGKFTPLTPDGITTAEAISNTRGSAMVIGLNVRYLEGEYPRVLAHELLHIMERRIDQIDVDILSEWISLTPGGHDAYYYSYHDENGNEMNDLSHTYYFESDPANAYFVDAYSKSFPTEDRARIFEKLVESAGDPYFADSPVMMAKARTLCRIIRDCFPSVAALGHASWEVR